MEPVMAKKRQVYHTPVKGVLPALQMRPQGLGWIRPKTVTEVRQLTETVTLVVTQGKERYVLRMDDNPDVPDAGKMNRKAVERFLRDVKK